MKKYIFGVLLIAILMCFTGCGSSEEKVGNNSLSVTKEEPDSASTEKRPDRLPSPIVECDSLEDAAARAKFDLKVPDHIEGYAERFISVYEMDFNMIQVIYSDKENAITIRKAPMSAKGAQDISGVYTTFRSKKTLNTDAFDIQTYGETEEYFNLACWADEIYNYSLYVEAGISEEELLNLVAQIG